MIDNPFSWHINLKILSLALDFFNNYLSQFYYALLMMHTFLTQKKIMLLNLPISLGI